ncbi:MAG: Asp/Glu/hydantoin racemase, partial [Spirochaetales bacterium]|nr:Asp/Glu/hydantoin racemase [Spirochaetales bacterium]
VMGNSIRTISALAYGAFSVIPAGDAEAHDRLIAETAKHVGDPAEVILLAQGSMARMEEPLAKLTGKTVLSSPRLGALMVKDLLREAR